MRLQSGLHNHARNSRKWLLAAGILSLTTAASAAMLPNLFPFFDPTGLISTLQHQGPHRRIHQESLLPESRDQWSLASDAFGLGVDSIRSKFFRSNGKDPLFAAIDGANCPDNSSNDPYAHSLLLRNGLIRIAMQVPANAQFQIEAYRDPYGCASVTDASGVQTVSVYRRPLPTTNLRYLSAVMFDGRETIQPLTSAATFQANLMTDLMHQSVDATLTHAQAAAAPTQDQQTAIVNFEMGLTSAQAFDFRAGALNRGVLGGPLSLSIRATIPASTIRWVPTPTANPLIPRPSLSIPLGKTAPMQCAARLPQAKSCSILAL